MPTFSVRVSEELAARFDTAADLAGGRSALLRKLVREAGLSGAAPVVPVRRDAARLMVRLGPAEAAHVAREAEAMGLRPAGWVVALVRRHARGSARFSREGELALLAIQGEIHRIGVNVNQIARALNTAVLEQRVTELQLGELEALRRELRAHMHALREGFEGNLAYWDVLE